MDTTDETATLPTVKTPIPEHTLDQLFREARTHSAWLPKAVPVELLRSAYELARLGPTSANSSPARFVFVTSHEVKERLRPALAPGNVEKTMAAPVTLIVAWDTEFHEQLPRLFPQFDMRSYFIGNQALIEETAFRNSSLQAAYFMLAARALGLDCGPMSGFDAGKVNAEFFPEGKWRANLLCNLGYGDPKKLFPRNPRLEFEEASVLL
ncbi:MAG: malonic semialdehyde reductase [Candidatus Acidiferrum sp.]